MKIFLIAIALLFISINCKTALIAFDGNASGGCTEA